jgi:Flp pilus assembly protein TadG
MNIKKLMKNQKGAAIVEFAFIAPLLLALLFGIIEFGLLLYNKAVITNACREAAREGIVLRNPKLTLAQLNTQILLPTVTNYTTSRLVSFDGNVTPNNNGSSLVPPATWSDNNSNATSDPGESLTVTVVYNYSFLLLPNLMQLVKGNLTSNIQINAVTVMRFE